MGVDHARVSARHFSSGGSVWKESASLSFRMISVSPHHQWFLERLIIGYKTSMITDEDPLRGLLVY